MGKKRDQDAIAIGQRIAEHLAHRLSSGETYRDWVLLLARPSEKEEFRPDIQIVTDNPLGAHVLLQFGAAEAGVRLGPLPGYELEGGLPFPDPDDEELT